MFCKHRRNKDGLNYYCKECCKENKKKYKHECVDCGNLITPGRERCMKCGIKHRSQNPAWQQMMIDRNKKMSQDPIWIKNHKSAMEKNPLNPEWKIHIKESGERRSKDKIWLKNVTEGARKRSLDPKFKENHKKSIDERSKNPEWIKHNREAMQKKTQDPKWRENNLISLTGQGFWYGHPILYKENKYCELFKEVDPRVRAFQGDRCLLCEKTEEKNSEKLHDHHVFYEKNACCLVDETGNYWSSLNIKGRKKDYYIGENPNYFALLCHSCHSKTNGNFEKRKYYANLLRNIIDTKFGGKSYYTEEEMIEHGYVKVSKTKWEKK